MDAAAQKALEDALRPFFKHQVVIDAVLESIMNAGLNVSLRKKGDDDDE